MAISSSRHLRRQANLQTLIQESGGASALGLLVGTPKSHISALVAGTRGIGDALAGKLERKCDKPEGWLDQDHGGEAAADAGAPSAARATTGQAALALARVLFAEGPTERDLLAHHVAHLVRNGPDERIASAIDAMTTVDVSVQLLASPARQESIPQRSGPVDVDHEVAAALEDLAVASATMTPAERRAMVDALRHFKETSGWVKSTPLGDGPRISLEPRTDEPKIRYPGGRRREEKAG